MGQEKAKLKSSKDSEQPENSKNPKQPEHEAQPQTLNEQIAALDAQVEWFYSDDFKLEEATEKYRQAVQLARKIEQNLQQLQNEIEVLTEDFGK